MNETAPTRQAAMWLLLATVGFGAFAFGATEIWARAVLRLLALVTLTLAWWSNAARWRSSIPRPARLLLVPGVLFVALALVQIVPVPRFVVGLLSPGAADVYERTVPPSDAELSGWLAERAQVHGVTVDPDAPALEFPETDRLIRTGRTLSLSPHATWKAAWSWMTALVLFAAAATLAADPWLRYRMYWGVAFLGGLLGVVAIAQEISWNNRLLWFRDFPPGSLPLGPFVNRSHFAGFVEMTVLISIGLCLALVSAREGRLDRNAIRAALLDDRWALPRLALAGGFAVLGVAWVLISESRGGLIALFAGLVALVVARRSRAVIAVLLVAVALVGLAAGLVAWVGESDADIESVPFALSGRDPSGALRLDAWGATLRAFVDHPVVGTGIGTFRWVFPAYQRGGEWKEWRYAHNDYVQLLGEAGLIGAALLIWALVRLWFAVVSPVIGDAGRATRWTSVAAAAAVIAMLVHTIVDFNLQIPSNAALFAVILGMLAAGAADPVSTEDA